jgi:hypothetical protein
MRSPPASTKFANFKTTLNMKPFLCETQRHKTFTQLTGADAYYIR